MITFTELVADLDVLRDLGHKVERQYSYFLSMVILVKSHLNIHMPLLNTGREEVTNKAFILHKSKHGRTNNFRMGDKISVGIVIFLLLLFSVATFHFERIYARGLVQRMRTPLIPSLELVQSLPYSIYPTMIAEDNTELSWPLIDIATSS